MTGPVSASRNPLCRQSFWLALAVLLTASCRLDAQDGRIPQTLFFQALDSLSMVEHVALVSAPLCTIEPGGCDYPAPDLSVFSQWEEVREVRRSVFRAPTKEAVERHLELLGCARTRSCAMGGLRGIRVETEHRVIVEVDLSYWPRSGDTTLPMQATYDVEFTRAEGSWQLTRIHRSRVS